MLNKGFVICLFMFLLNGCASYIANEMMSSQEMEMDGNLGEITSEDSFCDYNGQCVLAQGVGDVLLDSFSFEYKENGDEKIWEYRKPEDELLQVKPLNNQLIIIFPGYGQPMGILGLHQQWLQHITGADVFVIPSASKSENFSFGLNSVSPVIAEIQRRQPEHVHLVAFSMGAVAAQTVADNIEHATLHLIAPMTDFRKATKAVWKAFYANSFPTKFISIDTIEEAIQIVYNKSEMSPDDIDIVKKLQHTNTPTIVYSSTKDTVALTSDWRNLTSENIKLNTYDELNHLEMVALIDQNLMIDFTSNLLSRHVDKSEIDTIGILCDSSDEECLGQIE